MRRAYRPVPCRYCGKLISYNRMSWHVENYCPTAKEVKEQKHKEWLKTAPIRELTYGEVLETGRMEELKKAVEEDS